MSRTLKIISPVDNSVYRECQQHGPKEVEFALASAVKAQREWREIPVQKRKTYIKAFISAFVSKKAAISEELTWQMGRPLAHTPFEVRGTEERTKGMLDLAESSLVDIHVGEKEGFHRYIHRDPLGVIFVVPAWNYPYLIAVNSIVPALLAGNAVVLRHSAQTPLCAERFAQAFQAANLPAGLFQFLHLNHDDTPLNVLLVSVWN
jgi:acyl-CoA reductase-like NAD-dependent aldehyde dehydrogenase